MSSSPIRRPSRLPILIVTATAAAGLLATGCSKSGSAAAKAAPAPMEVGVLTIKPEVITLSQELPGRLSARRIAEVRARINGIVLHRLFTEGSDVKEGQTLYEIDPAPYQAALDSARAGLARAEAGAASAQAQAERFKGLVATNAIAKQTYDNAVASQLSAQADIAAAKAAVQVAEINLSYTRVTSPISGRIGRAEVTEGAYVQQATATLLATVQQLDSLYVDLNQPADELLRLKAAFASGRLQHAGEGGASFTITLDNGQAYGRPGSLQFSDVTVNRSTGTVTLRGTVPNPDLDLLPGMFVRAQLQEGTNPAAILVPQSVLTHNTKGEAVVMLVGTGGKVEQRVVQATQAVGNRWLVAAGLQPGDQVIVDHLQKIRPGSPVKPAVAAPPAPAASR